MSRTAHIPAALAMGILALAASGALAQTHPRLGLYHQISGSGFPYTTGGIIQGPFDTAVLDAVARYDEVVLASTPVTEYRPQLLAELRLRNPEISLLAYVLACAALEGQDGADSTVHYPTRYRRLMRDLDGYLYDQAGGHYTYNVNLAKKSPLGRYVVAEAVADLWYDGIIRTGYWDGLFLDMYCDGILWSQTAGEQIDFQRAGYPSLAAFDAGWKAGTEAMAARLRQWGGPDFVLVGNCGQGTKYSTFNGWMRENFPFQNGGTWQTNMYRAPGGYFTDDANFRQPTHNYIFGAADTPISPYAANSTREVRYVLGSASLGNGFGVFGPGNIDVRTYPYHFWWYDEYAVDLATGRSSSSLAHTGWLGEAIGPYRQMCWLGPGPEASTNPEFESDVTSGWVIDAEIPVTVTRDASTAGSGGASARIDLPARGGHEQDVQFATTGSISIAAGQSYSTTFWARAAERCTITVAAGVPNVSSGETQVAIGTTWQHYQAVIVATRSVSAGTMFFLGRAPNRVWLDDVHFRPGVTHVYRRDFRNGMVLVNPWGAAMDVALGRNYRRILGVADPVRNDGAVVSTITLPPSDAAFLIGDGMSPASVVDLRPTSP